MKKKGVEDVKKSKYFSVWDVIPYVTVVVVAVALLLVFLLPEKQEMTRFYVVYGDTEILSFDFDKDEFVFTEGYEEGIEIKDENGGHSVRVSTQDGTNVFFVNVAERSVKMTDADCSYSQDCTYMPKSEKEGDSIICVPNKLKIIAGGDGVSSPVTG